MKVAIVKMDVAYVNIDSTVSVVSTPALATAHPTQIANTKTSLAQSGSLSLLIADAIKGTRKPNRRITEGVSTGSIITYRLE